LIEGVEIAAGAWVLRNRETGRNIGVVMGGGKRGVTLVNPGRLQVEQDALERFLADTRGDVACLFFTGEPQDTDVVLWPGAAFITPSTFGDEMDLLTLAPGWEVSVLAPGSYLGLYSKKERILFCGDMLRHNFIPELKYGAQNYLDALDALESLDTRLVVPITGPEARGKREIKAHIEHDRSYTLSVLRHVLTSRAAHVPLERVVQVAAQNYEDYPHLETHLRNIGYTWEELAT